MPKHIRPSIAEIASIKRGNYADALAFVLSDKVEGGFSDDPLDPGGPTNHGIALNEVLRAQAAGELSSAMIQMLDVDGDGKITVADVKAWKRATSEVYFEQRYWALIHGYELPAFLAMMTFDSAINEGVPTATRHLQRTLGVEHDGIIGPETLAAADRAALNAVDREDAIVTMCGHRLERYRKLNRAERFFFGWSRRVVRVAIRSSAD